MMVKQSAGQVSELTSARLSLRDSGLVILGQSFSKVFSSLKFACVGHFPSRHLLLKPIYPLRYRDRIGP